MHLTLRQLEVFSAAARHPSFTAAAQSLHLSQPAVSMQIRQLEDNIGLSLFEPMGRSVDLTSAGHVLFEYVRQIEELLNEVEEVMEGMKGLHRGHLHITTASTANYFTARLLADFSRRYPGVAISLDVTNRETLLRQLANNETDIVIMGEPPSGKDLKAEAFMENPLVVISSPNHLWVNRKKIPLIEVAHERFILREPGSGTRAAIIRFFQDRGLSIRTSLEMSSNEAIKQVVGAGLGLGVVSEHTLELELLTRRLVILDVENMPIKRYWYMVQRRGKRNTPVTQAFHDYVLAKATSHVQPPDNGCLISDELQEG